MTDLAREDRRWLTLEEEPGDPVRVETDRDGADPDGAEPDGVADMEGLRSAFIDAFNDRDLETLLELVSEDVEFGDAAAEGREAMGREVTAIWERSPQVLLTRAFSDHGPCAMAWRPDEDGSWARAALVCFDGTDELITLVDLPDDPEELATVLAEDPGGDDVAEWFDWAGWDTGQESDSDDRR